MEVLLRDSKEQGTIKKSLYVDNPELGTYHSLPSSEILN
jgi:hypothetical protein